MIEKKQNFNWEIRIIKYNVVTALTGFPVHPVLRSRFYIPALAPAFS
jgi:hypothetical protein